VEETSADKDSSGDQAEEKAAWDEEKKYEDIQMTQKATES